MRPIVEAVRRRGSLLRDRQDVGPLGRHRPGAARRLAGRGAGERSVLLRRRLDGRRRAQGHALRRLLPTPSICRSCTSSTSRASSSASTAEKAGTIRHGARALAAVYQSKAPWCSILLRKSFGVAGAAHQNWQKLQFPLRLAVGRLGLAAARGRHRGRLQGRARRVARSGGAARARSRRGSTRCARRSAPPSASASRRSSTRATPGRCCASSPISPRRCASPARAASDTGRSAARSSLPEREPRLLRLSSS